MYVLGGFWISFNWGSIKPNFAQKTNNWASAGTRRHVLVLDAKANNGTDGGRCIISADQAVHFCGFAEEGSDDLCCEQCRVWEWREKGNRLLFCGCCGHLMDFE